MLEKVQKIIANKGFCSRREAEKLISEGKVFVNDKKIRLGDRAKQSDTIVVDGVTLENEEKVYFLLNKPRSVVSTSLDEKGRKTVVDLIETDKRIYPVGRLDYDTTGLILLTNDGTLTNILTHPKKNVPKTYLAKLNKLLSTEDLYKIKDGVKIDGKIVKVDRIKIKKENKKTNTSFIEITIHEGRYHVVKRLFQQLGYDVVKLTRTSFGNLYLGKMQSGEYRRLKKKEILDLYSYGEENDSISR